LAFRDRSLRRAAGLPALLCVWAGAAASVPGSEPKSLTAHRAAEPPRIDAVLDDPAWAGADARDDFLQSFPGLGISPSNRTVLRVAYDAANLYIAVECLDPDPSGIEARWTRRDRSTQDDYVSIDIDSYGDRRNALRFVLSAGGVQRDGALYNDREYDPEWDGIWEGRARRTREGWSAEMRIPFSQMPLRHAHRHVLGLQVQRYGLARNESNVWIYVPPWVQGQVSRYGQVEGIEGIQPASRLEILPYALARQRSPAPGLEFVGDTGAGGDAGLDLRYRPIPNFSLNATLNPDFGQVELDQVVLNLTTFETFYPEKRPFFLEGAGYFSTPETLFYSRRIGQPPPAPPLDPGETLQHLPEETTILGAAKWTGKTASGLTLGLLEVVTQSERAVVGRSDGGTGRELAAPQSSWSVVRLEQDVLRTSSVGFIGTLRDTTAERQAAAGGVDWALRLRDNEYAVTGQLLGTRVRDENVRRDGSGGQLVVAREGGLHWRWQASHRWLTPDADFNDMGFMSRPDLRESFASLQFREDRPGPRLQDWSVTLSGNHSENHEGDAFDRGANIDFSLQTTRFRSWSAGIYRNLETLDDRETRGGPPFLVPPNGGIDFLFSTDPRRRAIYDLTFGAGEEYDGHYWDLGVAGTWRAGRGVEFNASLSVAHTTGSMRWIDTVEDASGEHYLFADQNVHEADLTLGGLVALSADFSIQAEAQLFAADVDHSAVVELLAPDRLAETALAAAYSGQADIRFADLNAQVVARWQYRPGSYLTFVLTRRIGFDDEQAGQPLRHSVRDLWGQEGETVALIKLSYWWNP
jgi:hypothetical protein